MKFRDAYRAQYFIPVLENETNNLVKQFAKQQLYFTKPIDEVIDEFVTCVTSEVDQILLPIIAHEIAYEKSRLSVSSNSPYIRYERFFVENGEFTPQARFLLERYSFLFELVEKYVKSSFQNLATCLQRFITDLELIGAYFFQQKEPAIETIETIGSSDRHAGCRALLLNLSNSQKLIYKPTDLLPDVLFAEFVKNLKLPYPFELKTIKIAPRDDYGWLEYIPFLECSNEEELKNFFLRAGVLLAVTDALNYTDGHYDNLIACGAYPVLLDGETFFQNYPTDTVLNKNILSTQLIQKSSFIADQSLPFAALQSPYMKKFQICHPFAVNDHTDEIHVRYRGFTNEFPKNLPALDGKFYSSFQFVEQVKNGFEFAFDLISKSSQELLSKDDWWKAASQVKSRAVTRYFCLFLSFEKN